MGNKNDYDNEMSTKFKRQVTYEEGLAFKSKHNLTFFTEVSAKTGKGIQELVEFIAKCLFHDSKHKINDNKDAETSSVSSSHKSKTNSTYFNNSPELIR